MNDWAEMIPIKIAANALCEGRSKRLAYESVMPCNTCISMMTRGFAALEAAGWRIVAPEATEKMLKSATEFLGDEIGECDASDIWRLMLAAAPRWSEVK